MKLIPRRWQTLTNEAPIPVAAKPPKVYYVQAPSDYHLPWSWWGCEVVQMICAEQQYGQIQWYKRNLH